MKLEFLDDIITKVFLNQFSYKICKKHCSDQQINVQLPTSSIQDICELTKVVEEFDPTNELKHRKKLDSNVDLSVSLGGRTQLDKLSFAFIKETSQELFTLINDAYSVENFFKATTRFQNMEELQEAFHEGDFIGCFSSETDHSMKNCLGCVHIQGKYVESMNIDGSSIEGSHHNQEYNPQSTQENNREKSSKINALYFGSLSVRQDQQGMGIGSKLVSLVEAIARELKLPFIELYAVNFRKDLLQFYLRKDFKFQGEVEWPQSYIHTVLEHARKDVRFVVLRKEVSEVVLP